MAPSPASRLVALCLLAAPAAAFAQFCPLEEAGTSSRIVSCKDEVSMAECRRLAAAAGCAVLQELPLINAVVIQVPAGRTSAAETRLATLPEIERVDADQKVNWLRFSPAMPEFDLNAQQGAEMARLFSLRALEATPPATETPWGIRRVNAPAAWATNQGEGASVAVIDTGIDGNHPDLAGVVAGGFNAADPKNPGSWLDDQGHGTHVAGTIAAKRDGKGVAGVAPKAKLYAVKVLDKDGNGTYADVIAGIQWVVARKIPIANMSLGADEGSEPLRKAVAAAMRAGVTIVAAAGNSSGPVGYPAKYPETIAVAASDAEDMVAFFSSRGPEVDFIAPGDEIESAKMDGGTEKLSGTSMASPHVAGLAALAYARGARSPQALRAALLAAAVKLPTHSAEKQGAGMIDAAKFAR